MAAVRRRNVKIAMTEWTIDLMGVVRQLVGNAEVNPDDNWSFQVDGTTLVVTRVRPPEDQP